MSRTRFVPVLVGIAALFAASIPWAHETGALDTDPVGSIVAEALFPWAEFDSAIPTQAEITGVEHGERPLRPAEALTYVKRLAAISPRAAWLPRERADLPHRCGPQALRWASPPQSRLGAGTPPNARSGAISS